MLMSLVVRSVSYVSAREWVHSINVMGEVRARARPMKGGLATSRALSALPTSGSFLHRYLNVSLESRSSTKHSETLRTKATRAEHNARTELEERTPTSNGPAGGVSTTRSQKRNNRPLTQIQKKKKKSDPPKGVRVEKIGPSPRTMHDSGRHVL